MAFSQKSVSRFSARFTAFAAGITSVFCMCAALSQAARAQTVFEGEKQAQQNETIWGLKGEITGRVLLDNKKPAVGFVVRADFSDGQTVGFGQGRTITDTQGNYRIHGLRLWEDPFRVQVENYDKGYITEPARLIYINLFPKQKAAHVNFTLRRGPQITVRVRDAETGEPVADVGLKAQDVVSTTRHPLGKTNAKGEFIFYADDLAIDLRIDEATLRVQNKGIAPGYFEFNRLRLQKIADTVLDIKTYKNPYSHPAATFRGIVVDEKNKPISGAIVRLLRFNEPSQTTSDKQGRFAFDSKRVENSEWRAGMITAEKGSLKTTIFPTAQQTWGTLSVHLKAAPTTTVTGQVVSASGDPLAGVPIEVLGVLPNPTNSSMGLPRGNGGLTNATGHFSITGLLEEANYQFQFGGYSQFGQGGLWGKSVFPEIDYSNGWLHLQKGEARNIGRIVVYPADAVVAGQVIGVPGVAMDDLIVVITGKHYSFSVVPDAQGNFRFTNVVREPLKLHVYQSEDSAAPRKPGDTSRVFHVSPGSRYEVYEEDVQAGDINVSVVVTKTRRATP